MNEQIPTFGTITPYPIQWRVIQNTKAYIREQLNRKDGIEPEPAFINAYVSSGKTIIGGAIALHCQRPDINANLLVLARTGELVEQNAEEIFNMGGRCSIYSASLGQKSTYFNTVVGTEGTVANALDKDFSQWIPRIILIDECFTGDTLVTTASGRKRIDDPTLVNDLILCVDEKTMTHYYQKPLRVFNNGIKCVSRIKLKGGSEIRCTSTHKIWSNGYWVCAKDLQAGQKITLSGSRCTVSKKLLRASVAVVKKLIHLLRGIR